MSAYGITITLLATGLAEAVANDQSTDACRYDIGNGKFGPNVSEWIRQVAEQLSGEKRASSLASYSPSRSRNELVRVIEMLIPCAEAAEVSLRAEGLDQAANKCLTALDNARPYSRRPLSPADEIEAFKKSTCCVAD